MQFAVENIRRLFMFTNVINRNFHFFSYDPYAGCILSSTCLTLWNIYVFKNV